MPAFPKTWLWVLLALAFLVPLLQPVLPDVVSNYRLFLVSTMIIAGHRRAGPQSADRLQRPDFARPQRLLCGRRLHGGDPHG